MNTENLSQLPLNTFKDIPNPAPDAREIVSLIKEQGRIQGYKLSDGQVLGKNEAVALARAGGIQGVGIATRNGNEHLKSLPDSTENNNLGNLPAASE